MRIAKKDVKTLEDIEKWLATTRKIKFFEEFLPPNSINTFSDVFRILAKDKEATAFRTGNLHCDYNRERSVQDLLLVTKHYFPEKSYVDIMTCLMEEIIYHIENNLLFPYVRWCPDIKKYNFSTTLIPLDEDILSYSELASNFKWDLDSIFPNIKESTQREVYNILMDVWDKNK